MKQNVREKNTYIVGNEQIFNDLMTKLINPLSNIPEDNTNPMASVYNYMDLDIIFCSPQSTHLSIYPDTYSL